MVEKENIVRGKQATRTSSKISGNPGNVDRQN